ncbi:MAG: prepilin peptidase [Synergistes sp.]|nr:prepilin peptidase [Synergistes sp.]
MERSLLTISAFWLGAALGSFANAAAMRTAAGRKWWGAERSVCDSCGKELSARDLIPVVSFIALGGRCRSCGAKIPLRHLTAEIAAAAVLSFAALRFGLSSAFFFSAAALPFAAFHTLTDIETGYIYDSWAIAMAAAGLLLRVPHGAAALADGAAGAAAGFASMCAIIAASRGKMGLGDAMLAAGIGAFMGLKMTFAALYLAFLAGGITVLPLLIAKKVTRRTAVPFGPFLCAGMLAAMFFGSTILTLFGFMPSWPWL